MSPSSDPPAGYDADPAELRQADALTLELARRSDLLGAVLAEHLETGGGKIRARVALAAARRLGVRPEAAIPWAAACELLHNATLIHDDLQDGDTERRGAPALWTTHGDAQAINAGDLALMLPYRAVERIDAPAAQLWGLSRSLARRSEQTVRGQALELELLARRRLDWDSYVSAAAGKTGAVLALPAQGAAILAGRGVALAESIGDRFRDIGTLYQIQDDVVDLFGDKQRGPRGGDLRQGRVTALVTEHCGIHPGEREWLIEVLERPADETTDALVDEVAKRFESGETLGHLLRRASRIAGETLATPELRDEPELLDIARALANRCLKPLERLFEEHGIQPVSG